VLKTKTRYIFLDSSLAVRSLHSFYTCAGPRPFVGSYTFV